MCLWNTDAPGSNKVKKYGKISKSPKKSYILTLPSVDLLMIPNIYFVGNCRFTITYVRQNVKFSYTSQMF